MKSPRTQGRVVWHISRGCEEKANPTLSVGNSQVIPDKQEGGGHVLLGKDGLKKSKLIQGLGGCRESEGEGWDPGGEKKKKEETKPGSPHVMISTGGPN